MSFCRLSVCHTVCFQHGCNVDFKQILQSYIWYLRSCCAQSRCLASSLLATFATACGRNLGELTITQYLLHHLHGRACWCFYTVGRRVLTRLHKCKLLRHLLKTGSRILHLYTVSCLSVTHAVSSSRPSATRNFFTRILFLIVNMRAAPSVGDCRDGENLTDD